VKSYKELTKPFFALAPMDDVTDTVFRQIINDCAAPDLAFTEFVNVDGLMSVGRSNLLKKLQFVPTETNLVAQIWGLKPDNFQVIANQIASGAMARDLGLPAGCNFVGIDLNMGCPAKSEVKNGACAALIKTENRDHAQAIIKATKKGSAGRLPVSVKTRVGFSTVDLSWFEFLFAQEPDMITVHGRTRKQMSKVPADWNLIGQVRQMRDELSPHTLIVGNGDVLSRAQGCKLASDHKLDGVMIGRGVFHDPYVFSENSPWESMTKEDKIALFKKHVQLFADTWKNNERRVVTLNKFCKIYVQGFDGAKELREQLMEAETTQDLINLLDQKV
jgi:tRNA-dihydrouridine synthase